MGFWRYSDMGRGWRTGDGIYPRLTGQTILEVEIAPAYILVPTLPRYEGEMPQEPVLPEFEVPPPPPERAAELPQETAFGEPSALAGKGAETRIAEIPDQPAPMERRTQDPAKVQSAPHVPSLDETPLFLVAAPLSPPAVAPFPDEPRIEMDTSPETSPLPDAKGLFFIPFATTAQPLDVFLAPEALVTEQTDSPDNVHLFTGRTRADPTPSIPEILDSVITDMILPIPVTPVLARWDVKETRFGAGGGLTATTDSGGDSKPTIPPLDAAVNLGVIFTETPAIPLPGAESGATDTRALPRSVSDAPDKAIDKQPRPTIRAVTARHSRGWHELRRRAEPAEEFIVAIPDAARGSSGRTIVKATISAYGICLDAAVVFSSGSGILDQTALDATRNLHYSPAQSRDEPVISVEWFEIVFPRH